MKLKHVVMCAVLLFVGCVAENNQRDYTMNVERKRADDTTRFEVVFCGSFKASSQDRAMNRSIYIVKDKTNNIEYLAIEGCGTAQLVHQGKTIQEQ